MEVIRHGNTYKEVECEECGALFLYCKADIKKEHCTDVFFGEFYNSYRESIKCPECENKILLKILINGKEVDC